VAINCAAIPATLLESELFGHERGAFTDAHATKTGLIEEAHGGTLFLDEIGHLPLPLQGKLLRTLEERSIRRLGANETRWVDVRIVAATHVNLERAVEAGEFREDLFYRLNVVALRLPALRERGDDLLLLAEYFVDSLARRYGLRVPPLTAAVRTAVRHHDWPGNVRELRHAIERALLLSPPGHLDPSELGIDGSAGETGTGGVIPFPATLRDVERAAVRAALTLHEGNKSAAARALNISRTRLQRMIDADEGAP
jgi:transcriptional regulator with PAS, ATPase and Fis domain